MATLIAGILIGVVFASVFWRWPDLVRELPFLTRIEACLAAIRQGAGDFRCPRGRPAGARRGAAGGQAQEA